MLSRLLSLYERHVQALETFNALKGSELLAYNERCKIETEKHARDQEYWRTFVDGLPPPQRHELLLRSDANSDLKGMLDELRATLDSFRFSHKKGYIEPGKDK